MSNKRPPDLSLFWGILQTLEAIGAPYMIIGAFAANVYGVTRTTYDIDIVVDLGEEHIQALVAAYPPPRYYAGLVQMRDSTRMGIMFNIIDGSRGEKADLVPITMDARYRQALQRRIRQVIGEGREAPLEVWCARPEDVIVGKLMAWAEGRSRRHETDIYEMMLFRYLELDPELSAGFDESLVDAQARELGPEVWALWETARDAARQEAGRHREGMS